jgi:hypothetical protein
MSATRLHDMALRYAERGWPVLPCHSPDPSHPTGCTCRRRACEHPGKHPKTRNGYLDASDDLEQVGKWWRWWPDSNIGFAPGRAGLLVIDIDGPEGETEAERLGLLSGPTLTALTARGRHLYFQHPGGTIGNGKLNGILDVRADKGLVLIPPSRHVSGHVYRWAGKASEILPLTPDALEALRPAKRPTPAGDVGQDPKGSRYIARAIESECLTLAQTPEGARNHQLNVAAFNLARFVASGEADPGRLIDVLRFAAAHAGLEDHEIEKTIESAFRARGVSVCMNSTPAGSPIDLRAEFRKRMPVTCTDTGRRRRGRPGPDARRPGLGAGRPVEGRGAPRGGVGPLAVLGRGVVAEGRAP